VVLFDEVSLEPQLQYDDNFGCIVGFEDNGLDRTQRFADHSLVLMIKGLQNILNNLYHIRFVKAQQNDMTWQIKLEMY